MKKRKLLFTLIIFSLLLGSCMIKTDVAEKEEDIDEAITEAEEKAEDVAKLLSATTDRTTVTEAEIKAIDEAIAEADKKAHEAAELIVKSQPSDIAVYLQGIQGELSRCLPGKMWWEVISKAEPDEDFYGPCEDNNYFKYSAPTLTTQCYPPDKDRLKKKKNEAYVWGLTQYEDKLFFGTISNVPCLVMESIMGIVAK